MFFSFNGYSQEIKKLSLDECIKLARENHPYYQDIQRIEDNSTLKTKNVNTQWLPQINGNAQATYQSEAIDVNISIPQLGVNNHMGSSKDQYKFWLDVNQMLYDGGSVASQRNMTKALSKAEQYQNEAELHKITEQVNQTFFGSLLFKENIKLLEDVKQNLLKRQKTVEEAVKNGALQQSDLINISVEVLKNQQQIDEMNISYKTGLSILSELTGKQINDSIELIMPLTVPTDTGNFTRPELKALEFQISSLDFNQKLSGSQRLPKVFAFTQAGYGKPGLNMLSDKFDTYYYLGLSMKWNLWDWSKSSREKKTYSIQKEMLESKTEAIEKNLRIAVDNSRARIEQLKKSLATDSTIVDMKSTVTKISAVKLEQGIITANDYITDLNSETQAKIQLKTHIIQLEQEKINLLTIKGTI
jgi:outer membrane protein TolC